MLSAVESGTFPAFFFGSRAFGPESFYASLIHTACT